MKVSQWLNVVLGIAVLILGVYCANNKAGAKEADQATQAPKKQDLATDRIERLGQQYDQRANLVFDSFLLKAHGILKKSFYPSPFNNIGFARTYQKTFEQEEGTFLAPRQDLRYQTDFTKSIWVDSLTLAKWVLFFKDHDSCDGIRVYLSKYNNYVSAYGSDQYDVLRDNGDDRGQYNQRYSMIFAMTYPKGKDAQGNIIHRDIIEKTETEVPDPLDPSKKNKLLKQVYPGIYNYTNLCPPSNCPTKPLE